MAKSGKTETGQPPQLRNLPCPLCGRRHEGVEAFAHILVAHGPLKSQKRPRARVRSALPRIHRRLEEQGYDEVQAHLIVRLVAEELRKAGAI